MKNIAGYYQFMMRRSLPLKITAIVIFLSFPISIIFTIACLSLSCSYSTLYQPCSYLTQDNPNECTLNSVTTCCGQDGDLTCLGYSNCVIKPSAENISSCEGVLITSWVLYSVFIIATIVFLILYRKLGPQIADDYTRMSQDIEISHQNSHNQSEYQ